MDGRRTSPASITEAEPTSGAEWVALHQAYAAWRRSLPGEALGGAYLPNDSEYRELSEIGPDAGQTFNDPTPSACADRLEGLKAKGFRVPQYAIDALREEAQDTVTNHKED